MKKAVILFIGFVFTVSLVQASNGDTKNAENAMMTTSVSGKVLDKSTGEALVGVKVTVNESGKSTYTDFDGNFTIDGVKPGMVQLSTSYISYKEKVETIDVNVQKQSNVDVLIESVTE